MPNEISEADFIETLKVGVKLTTDFIARLTEFHGGPIETEYILTSDIARAFLEGGHEVGVEVLNRKMVNGLTSRSDRAAKGKLGAQRTDVAVMSSGLQPLVMIEVKINVRGSLRPIRGDLEKIVKTLDRMKARYASDVRAASVFQVHVLGRDTDSDLARLKLKISKIEMSLRKQLKAFALDWRDFIFRLLPLQDEDGGFVPTEIEVEEDGTEFLGRAGHATRYYAVLISSTRSPPTFATRLDALRSGE